jgi:ADP-ribose pyrophosphatase YjhB (NUDIX family)
MGLSWEDSYLGQLRTLAGNDRVLIIVGARCLVRDDQGRILLIKRADNGRWALPAGTMELGETISECATRELWEETGLQTRALTLIGIDSNVGQSHTPNMFGHAYQHIAVAFRIDEYEGALLRTTDETTDAAFYPTDALPADVSGSVGRTLADLAVFERTGRAPTD